MWHSWTRDDKFSDAYQRWQNREELDRLVEGWTLQYTAHDVMRLLQQVGVAAIPSFSSQELYTDPHLNERGFWVEVEHPVIGKQTVAAPPWKLSSTPAKICRHAPLLGEHNQYVFGELLHLSAEEISELEREKVLW